VNDEFGVECKVYLGELSPEEVLVEAYVRPTTGGLSPQTFALHPSGKDEEGWERFRGSIQAQDSGSYEFNVRVIPFHPSLMQKHELRLTTWSK
jgi:starch phosphorylase